MGMSHGLLAWARCFDLPLRGGCGGRLGPGGFELGLNAGTRLRGGGVRGFVDFADEGGGWG